MTILFIFLLGAICFVLISKPKHCGSCIPEDFIPLNEALSPEARAQARVALTYLDHLKINGEDPADVGDEIDPSTIVMIQGEDADFPLETGSLPESGREPFGNSNISSAWYADYPYQLVTDNNGTGRALNGGGISSNWWIGPRYRYGMFPAGTWKRWNGKYMYLSNNGILGERKVAPLG